MPESYDYHFLVLAPGLSGAWFTQAAHQFWRRYQPIVTQDWELISRTPADAEVAVTLLARRGEEEVARRLTSAQRNDIHFDLVVANSLTEMEVTLNKRAQLGLMFGD